MRTQSTAEPVTAFGTTDEAIVEVFIDLFTTFTKNETAPLNAFLEGQAPHTPANREAEAVMKEISTAVDHEVDVLLVNRLAANNRQVPLLRMSDADRVTHSLMAGTPIDDKVAVLMALLSQIAPFYIKGTLVFLAAFDPNPYAAFWKFTAALTNEAVRSELTLKQVVASPESRANVYRASMTYPTWRKLTAARINLAAGVTPSSIGKEVSNALPDGAAAEFDQAIADSDKQTEAWRSEKLGYYKEFYVRLGRQIWPTGNRH